MIGGAPSTEVAPAAVLSIGHQSSRTGAPRTQLALARWVARHRGRPPRLVELAGGALEGELRALGASILGPTGSRGWLVERGASQLGMRRTAGVAAMVRHAAVLAPHARVEVVHLSSIASVAGLRFLPGRPRVVTHVHELGPSIDEVLSPAMWDVARRRSDAWLAASDGVAADLRARGVPSAAIQVHHEMIEPPVPDPAVRRAVRRRVAPGGDELVVGMVGTTDWRKGPDLFVRVAAQVRARRPELPVRFVWVGGAGTGPERWMLDHDIERAGLGDRVALLGETDDPASCTAALDVLCLTSREDPFPLVALEASALEVPVVALDSGGIGELAEAIGGRGPVVVPALDVEALAGALVMLLEDAGQRSARATAAARHVRSRHLVDVAAPGLWAAIASSPGASPTL